MPVSQRGWNVDRFVHFATYRTFGEYGKSESPNVGTDTTNVNELITKMEKSIKEAELASSVHNSGDAKPELISQVEIHNIDSSNDASLKNKDSKGKGPRPANTKGPDLKGESEEKEEQGPAKKDAGEIDLEGLDKKDSKGKKK